MTAVAGSWRVDRSAEARRLQAGVATILSRLVGASDYVPPKGTGGSPPITPAHRSRVVVVLGSCTVGL